MGCGSSKNAVRVAEPTAAPSPAAAAAVPGKTASEPIKLPPPREPSQTPARKVFVRYEETGRTTGIMLSGWDQDDAKTVEDMAKVLVASHAVRLQQLGFAGATLVLFDVNGAVRPPRQRISEDELLSSGDMKRPLRVGLPPQWSPDAAVPQGHRATTPRQGGNVLCSAATTTTASQGSTVSHTDRIMLSPRSKAYRAEVEAIQKRHSPQNKSPVYKPDAVFPDLIKRDIHSHLKKHEIKEEPAQPQPTQEEVQALQKPKGVQPQKEPVFELDTARVNELAMQLMGFMSKYRDKNKEALLKELKSFLEADSWEELNRQSKLKDSAWSGQACIEWLRAYIDFAKHHGLGSKNGKLRLELRNEIDPYYPGQIHQTPPAKKSYALIPAEWSLLRSLDGAALNYLLDESEGYGMLSRWASGRFLDPTLSQQWSGPPMTRPSFGFCGQLPGISKQVTLSHPTLAPLPTTDRAKCFDLCRADDPGEWPLFEKLDMEAFLVQIRMGASQAVEQALKPLVVLDAAVFCRDELDQDDSQPYWQTLPGFGEGCIPGFCKSGRAVMLIQSALLSVTSVQDLQLAGLTCSRLPVPTAVD